MWPNQTRVNTMAAQNPADGGLWDKAITANPLRDNGATVLMGGNISTATSTVTNAPDLAITGAGKMQPSGVVKSAYTGATHSVALGDFAKQTAGRYIVKGGNITAYLAGIAYRGLRGAGNQNQNSGGNASRLQLARETIVITSWNYATGVATKAANNADSFTTVNGGGTYVVPTRALPGNVITLPTGRETPTTTALPAKVG